MKLSLPALVLASTFAGSAMAQKVATPATAAPSTQAVQIAKSIPYAEDNDISDDIKKDCELGSLLSSEIAKRGGAAVRVVDGTPDRAHGRTLDVQIVDAVAGGNAWIGHQKSTKIKGVLYQDGQRLAGFKARNNSMGGAFGGFKGSCSVLGRTLEGLAKDVVEWLKAPKDGVVLGD